MKKSFAGFWVDGTARKPEKKHYDEAGLMIVLDKRDNTIDTWYIDGSQDDIVNHYWLDTTAPTEFTPQQAFEMIQLMHPECTAIQNIRGFVGLVGSLKTNINWGDTAEYPPKKPDVWRIPTDADKGKKCRYKDDFDSDWMVRDSVTFHSVWQKGFIVVYGGEAIMPWRYCEVLDENN